MLSDCHSAALVDRDGSVDWWCVPRFDSPSVFGRLLDRDAGYWALRPAIDYESERSYLDDTMVLRTVFRTADGSVSVTDGLGLEAGARGHDIGLNSPHVLLRRIEGLSGAVDMYSELVPRMEYGRTQPHLRPCGDGVEARGGPACLTCTSSLSWEYDDGCARTTFRVAAGEVVELALEYRPSFGSLPPREAAGPSLADTIEGWRSWAADHTGYEGAFAAQVRRSSLVLQGLTYQPSGAVVAAATTSLPEELGADRNYDYRFAWLRDLSLTIRSLWIAACPSEPDRLFDWFANAAGKTGDELVQIMYGVEGERDLSEHSLEHLSGYRDSQPVRAGNAAWRQQQLDVLGEVLDAVYGLRDSLGDLEASVQDMLVLMANRAATGWSDPDAGMWEARDKKRHYTSSKVLCWVALDRAVKLASRLGERADPETWSRVRDELHAVVVKQAWSSEAQAYTGAFGSDELDASVLLMPIVGFLPADDPRMWTTIEAIEDRLGDGGLVRRWATDSGGFLICTYWLAECLALAGHVEDATAWFQRATEYANDLGLLTEMADPSTGELLGNFPQAFSHVGLINAAWAITQATEAE
ncbi:glycoside hydrolase family 15 protein [soil metagenome]